MEYSQTAPVATDYLHIQANPVVATIQETSSVYNFDGSCCCYKNDEETVVSPTAFSIARRFGCCCCIHSDHTVIRANKVAVTKINVPVGACVGFFAWLSFGCLGWHRLCFGRTMSGWIMGAIFAASIVFCTFGLIFGIEYSGRDSNATPFLIVGILGTFFLSFTVITWFVDLFFLRKWS